MKRLSEWCFEFVKHQLGYLVEEAEGKNLSSYNAVLRQGVNSLVAELFYELIVKVLQAFLFFSLRKRPFTKSFHSYLLL